MFKSTLRNAMFAVALIAVIAVSTSAANACDSNKGDHSVKSARPLSALVQHIKHWLNGNDKSPNNEPSTDDSGYVPTDDSEPLPISG